MPGRASACASYSSAAQIRVSAAAARIRLCGCASESHDPDIVSLLVLA
jgi:hypothetical protein